MGRTKRYKCYSPVFKREALKHAGEDGATDRQGAGPIMSNARPKNG